MSDRLATLIVALEAQHASLRRDLDKAAAHINDFGKKATSSFDRFAKQTENLAKTIKGLFVFDLARDAVNKLVGFVADGAKALAEEEKSANQLGAAFQALGYDAGKLLPYFNDLAETLEAETLIDGETIRQVEQLLVQFGIAPKAIESATRAVLDYSAATGKEATAAATQLLSAVTSGKEEIGKLGIDLETTGDKTQDFLGLTDQLTEKFGGSAAAATQGFAGQMGALSKATSDLSKAMADFFLKSDAGQKVLKGLTEAIQGVTYALSDEHKKQQEAAERTEKLASAEAALVKINREIAESEAMGGDYLLANRKAMREATLRQIAALREQRKAAEATLVAEVTAANEAANAGESAAARKMAADERRIKAEKEAAAAGKKAAAEQEAAMKRLIAHTERHAEAQQKSWAAMQVGLAGNERAVAERQREFALAGTGATGPATGGFSDFEAALADWKSHLDEIEDLQRQAAMAVADENHELAGELEIRIDRERALAAKSDQAVDAAAKSDQAVDAFVDITKASVDAARALRETARQAQEGMLAKAMGPRVSGLFEAGKQGAAAGMAAGPEGAIIGALAGIGLELLTQSQQFGRVMEVVDEVIQSVADGLGKLIEPLFPFLVFLEPLGAMLGYAAEILGNIFAPGLELLWNVLKPVVAVVLTVTKFLGSFWNALVGMLQALFRTLGGIEVFGGKPLGFLTDWAKGLDKSKVNLGKIDDALANLDKATYEGAKAQVAGKDAQEKLTKATDNATESLTNVPSGYKVALERFNAANGEAARGAGAPGAPAMPPAGGPSGPGGVNSGGGDGGSPQQQAIVQVYIDGDEVLQRLRARQQQQAVRQSGRVVQVNPRLVGAF